MSKRVLLIVEDHDMTRRTLARLFRREGWEVAEAATIRDGLAGLDPPPDCAIVDLMLPDGGGEDVVRAIKERGLPTGVAVCSGTGDLDRLRAVEALGPRAVLRKPIDAGVVLAACDGMVRDRRAASVEGGEPA